jgi:hypothetical protein
MSIDQHMKSALENIHFIERYRELSRIYSFDLTESFKIFDYKEVLKIFEEFGYKVKYFKGDQLFQIVEENTSIKFMNKFILKRGIAQLSWYIYRNDTWSGSVWNIMKTYIDGTSFEDEEDKIYWPVFRNYEDLRGLLRIALEMYEDFKREYIRMLEDEK